MPKKPAIKAKDVDGATSHARNVLAQVLGWSRTPASPNIAKQLKAKRSKFAK